MVISIVIALTGGLALLVLPVQQYPQITPPTVSVSASYPGASAEVVADVVGGPLETAINGVDDMLYMSSTSSNAGQRSEEHTSELQSLMRISYAVFCLKKKTYTQIYHYNYLKYSHNTHT